ncbi:AzlD domain-containing protein [Paenibacillus sp. TAB 01]|uniref:AzlD domain-containing protein n=1 Tax=Paenibacillus sp. TAB 01 TaxID=3368988 RepID=UPI0037527EA4
MEVRWDVFVIILGAAFVTFLPRVVPLLLLSRLELPSWGLRWLNYVPVSVMAALIGQALFVPDGKWVPLTQHPELWAALPTVLVAVLTRSLLFTVIAGMLSIMLLRFLAG